MRIEYPIQFPGEDANDDAWKKRMQSYDTMLESGMNNYQVFDWYFKGKSDKNKSDKTGPTIEDLFDTEQN